MMAREKREKKERQKEAARLRRQRKPKPDAFKKWNPQPSKFLQLPLEVRNEIYRLMFLSMANEEDGKMYVSCTDRLERGHWVGRDVRIKQKHDESAATVQILPVLQVCKQVHYEAKQVFWSSMTFTCKSSEDLQDFCEVKQLPHRRPKKTLPKLFPIDLVCHLELCVPVNKDHAADVLEAFWALARVASPSFEPKVSLKHELGESRQRFGCDEAAALAIYREVKVYQAWRIRQGLSLDADRYCFSEWINWDATLEFSPKMTDKDDEISSK